MIGAEQAIAAAYAAFQRKDYATARQHLTGVKHPQAVHLLGLVEKGAGHYEAAKTVLEEAARLSPKDPEIVNNQGLLARLMGDFPLARTLFVRALSLKPDFRSARLSLGRTLRGLGLYTAAIEEFERLVVANGNDLAARVGCANAALDLGKYEIAKEHIDAALVLDPESLAARFAQGVLLFGLGAIDDAEAVFTAFLANQDLVAEASHMMARVKLYACDVAAACKYAEESFSLMPSAECLKTLADIYWMYGDKDAFDTLMQRALAQPGLELIAISLIGKSGKESQALSRLDGLPVGVVQSASCQSLRSGLLLDLGDVQGAIDAGRKAAAFDGVPEDNFNLVRALLAAGEAREALSLIGQGRQRDPLDQFWLGYEVTALRLLDDPRYDDLTDYDRHVQASQLPVPEGFATLEAFNAAFLELLDEMNPFEAHPLHQSLRGGGQSPHNLAISQHPLLKAYFKALHKPIENYMAMLGTSPDHPSSARNTGAYMFSGSWSVRLSGGGHHVNHLHPRGWISSSYYVSVPEETLSGKDRSGWIKFGEPPVKTQPVLGPEKWVQPKAGMVVLFPSFLWHGTAPIHDGSVRVTAPFDVVPVRKGKL